VGVEYKFIIMVNDINFIPTLDQVENIIRLLDKYGIAACNYPSKKENAFFIQDMKNEGVIRPGKKLVNELRDPYRHQMIEQYLFKAGFNVTARLWMEVRAYDPSMFLSPGGDAFHYINPIQNPRLWASFRADYSEAELPYMCSEGGMYITDRPPQGAYGEQCH